MKKINKKITAGLLACVGLVSFATGCSMSDDEGKVWAEQNGYVKEESNLGEYEFSHVVVKADHVRTYTSCPTSGTEEYDYLYGYCDAMQGVTLNVVSENEITAKIGTESETSKFVIDENGYLFVTDKTKQKTESNIKYLVKDGKIFIIGNDSTNTDGDYTYTIVFTKK